MSWDQRQRAMLAEMGYRLPPLRAAAETDDTAVAVLEAPPEVQRATPAPHVVERPVSPVAPSAGAIVARMPAPSGDASTLDALREAVLTGRSCGGCEHRVHLFGRGVQPQADWLIVTEPPDEGDERAAELMSGDAGRLLDRMLLAAGHRLGGEGANAFVAPIVPGRAPRGRPPLPQELQAGEAVIARLAGLLQPRLVLAMGLNAARRLTGSNEPLGKLRGRVHQWQGRPVIVTFHPGYLLRNPADKRGAWDDLRLAMASARG